MYRAYDRDLGCHGPLNKPGSPVFVFSNRQAASITRCRRRVACSAGSFCGGGSQGRSDGANVGRRVGRRVGRQQLEGCVAKIGREQLLPLVEGAYLQQKMKDSV